jgi:hypothetical protein
MMAFKLSESPGQDSEIELKESYMKITAVDKQSQTGK